ncbi:beta-galactosidase [Granulicella aggregans]|uniref:Beta-galactosidase n=1 Tax=Granulicella aggregans TaxID=474949 RepID=A0A7W8E2B3_9BACT|nr:beta-galactosidase [Granulicella aggregans]MBB5056718.1 beta-galactosidase [Granulicella aggregans]
MDRRMFVLSAGATVATLGFLPGRVGFSQGDGVNVSSNLLLLGTDYYPDQTPEHLWEDDAVQMAAMGITNVRIAEFAWALMEPREGFFHFEWLERSVKILNAHGIAVILGTPTAAPPSWLSKKYPEILIVNEHGVTLTYGSRRFTCPTNKTYRKLSLTIATEMAKRFASTPGVAGWQIDNELTLGSDARCYCRFCGEGFQAWTREKYKTLEAVNEAWGTVFWSNTYTDWTQIPVPLPSGAPTNPGLMLDYDRYQSYANVSYLEEQLMVLRRECPKHFITTNNLPGVVDTIDARDLYRKLDFVSADNYPGFFALFFGGQSTSSVASFAHDFSRSAKDGKPFMIMEEQSGKAGQPYFSPQPEPGQIRLWTYQAVAHGAMGINYFRWDTANFGAEEYWHGMIRHDRSHSPGFDEMRQTIKELKSLGHEALNAPYVAEVALCFDSNSDWALTIQPSQMNLKYATELMTWYGCVGASNAGVDIVDATKDLSQYKVLYAPVMYIVTKQQAERIRSFVQGGGTFVAGFRLGVKEENDRVVDTPLPGLLRDVMGVEVLDTQPIYSEKQGVKFSGMLAGNEAECKVWSDILDPKGADVLATYTTGQYAGKAAITSHGFGKGKAIYVGAHLEPADLARVLLTLSATSGVKVTADVPRGVEITTRRSNKGTLTYLLNYNAAPVSVKVAGKMKDALSGAAVSETVSLEGYGVRVLEGA